MQEPNTPKVFTRRKDIDSITKDLRVLKGELYRTLYGSGWNKKRKRTRSIWGIEYQKNLDNPHINLLIESLPYPFDSYEATLDLFDKELPKKVKCLSPFKGDATSNLTLMKIFFPTSPKKVTGKYLTKPTTPSFIQSVTSKLGSNQHYHHYISRVV